MGYFRDLGGLRPGDEVLDVGCGIGRMAVPLTNYIRIPGSYDGFDVVRDNIDWCVGAVQRRHPHFRFVHADIFSREYNPRGVLDGNDFRFPYADGEFDFVFLTSVFTHMLPDGIANYFREVSRVLRSGRRCFATLFLLNEESVNLIAAGQAHLDLVEYDRLSYVRNVACPEECIAVSQDYVVECARTSGFADNPDLYYGSWAGGQKFTDSQDIGIFTKR